MRPSWGPGAQRSLSDSEEHWIFRGQFKQRTSRLLSLQSFLNTLLLHLWSGRSVHLSASHCYASPPSKKEDEKSWHNWAWIPINRWGQSQTWSQALKVRSWSGAPTVGSKPVSCTTEQDTPKWGWRHSLWNHGVKLTEGSGTCFQFLRTRCTVTTRTVITDKFFSLLSLWFQEHSSTSGAPNPRLPCLLHWPLSRLTHPLSSPWLH